MNETTDTSQGDSQPQWQPLNSRQRRVLGVLIEKAKTTPDAYPMTLNALTNGCNQKSNRSPQMSLTADDVEQVIEELREMGAVLEIQGSGRVLKYRHQMYEWLGVDKVELAVMGELLLRGEQTVGELRTRASRMEPIAGLNELKPILRSLIDKRLVMPLTPEGRGQVVTHGLYKDRELEALQSRVANLPPPPAAPRQAEASTAPRTPQAAEPPQAAPASPGVSEAKFDDLEREVAALRDEVLELRDRMEKIERMLE
jgi:uncharacterized protein YceH (UPF0502 family)